MEQEMVRVKMLGNVDMWETGKSYDLPADRANQLCGIGYAVLVERKPAKAKE